MEKQWLPKELAKFKNPAAFKEKPVDPKPTMNNPEGVSNVWNEVNHEVKQGVKNVEMFCEKNEVNDKNMCGDEFGDKNSKHLGNERNKSIDAYKKDKNVKNKCGEEVGEENMCLDIVGNDKDKNVENKCGDEVRDKDNNLDSTKIDKNFFMAKDIRR